MFSISVELLHGIFRGDALGTANTGHTVVPDGRPRPFGSSPRSWRRMVPESSAPSQTVRKLGWLERLPPPVIHADCDPPHTEIQPRYVVEHRGTAVRSTHQEYVGRKATLIRPGVRVAPRNPRLVYSWNVDGPPETNAHGSPVSRGPHRVSRDFGFPVRIRVRSGDSAFDEPGVEFVPDSEGTLAINVPASGDLRILDQMYEAWRKHGAGVGRSQFPGLRHEAAYRDPRSEPRPSSGGVVAWLRLGFALSGRRISVVTGLFKEAVLSQHQRIFGDPPAVLHGHGFTGKGYELARFLALPDVGFRHSRGRIQWTGAVDAAGNGRCRARSVRRAAFSVRRLVGNGVDIAVEPRDGNRPLAIQPSRWERKSREWVTAFPAIHERRRTLDLAEIGRWCQHAGLPAPIAFRSARTPLVPGAVDLAPVEVHRPNRPWLPYCHVAVRFADPVSGPVVIGSGRQRGLGCA